MRKLIIVLLFLCGLGLIGGGGWWIWKHTAPLMVPEKQQLEEVQAIGIEQNSIKDGALFGTAQGLQFIKISTGEVTPVGGSFAKLTDTVQQIIQSSDGSYWIIKTTSVSDKLNHWYLVDWHKNKFQRLDETLRQNTPDKNLTISQVIISTNNTAVLVSTSRESTASTMTNAPERTMYALATLALDSLNYQSFGSVGTSELQLLKYDAAQNEIIFQHTENNIPKISGKRYSSNQNYDLVADAREYLIGPDSTQLLEFSGNNLQLTDVISQKKGATLSPQSGNSYEPQVYWANSGDIFATVEYNPAEIAKKIVSFHSNTGSKLFSQTLTGSQVLQFSADGQAAVIISQDATEDALTGTTVIYHFVKPYEGASLVFSNIPPGSQLVGVF